MTWSRTRALTAVVALVALVAALPASAQPSDTISIVKEGEEGLSNAEIAARLSESTFQSADRVVIGRDDEFADAMTSGLLQADSPLLLVPRGGPVPQRVLDQLQLLDPAEVLLLGGVDAIAETVAEELDQAGYAVERAFGASRFETATEIADLAAADADTVLIARAFADPGAADPTQAFADALAAGGWAAENRWPILLTQTDVLTGTTRDWLADHDVEQAFILGGTAAVSDAVATELASLVGDVERVAGADRFETAIEVAAKRGADSAADAARVTLVEAQDADAWAGGFASAAHSAAFDAPVVLANGSGLPDATEDWLGGGSAFAQTTVDPGDVVLTCVSLPEACDEARAALDLPPAVTISFDPPGGSVEQGTVVTVTVDGELEQLTVDGTCLASPATTTAASQAVTLTEPGACELVATATLAGGATQSATAGYDVGEAPVRQIVYLTSDLATDGTTGDIRLVGIDGSAPQIAAPCDQCRDLRLSPAATRSVTVEPAGLVLRSAPGFDDPVLLAAADSVTSFAYPQFTPTGDAVVVTRYLQGVPSVVHIDLSGTVTGVAEGATLAGFDAVGATAAVSGGVGALVLRTSSSPDGTVTSLLLVDVLGADEDQPLFSTSLLVASASINPGGTAFAASLPGAGRVVVGTLPGSRTTLSTPETEQVVVYDPVWRNASTLVGVDGGQLGPRPVAISIGSGQLDVTAGPVVEGLQAPGRVGQLPDGRLLVDLTGHLATAAGDVLAAHGDVITRNPQLLAPPS
ncbi:cell wall-binding repeat-containing protein [Euzebya sp.]|uniref:cell wall-binding repeat-containing protein n=1 Tax=Euzebya sp. TaxID=1971409 RepID=UPI003519B80D